MDKSEGGFGDILSVSIELQYITGEHIDEYRHSFDHVIMKTGSDKNDLHSGHICCTESGGG